MQTHNHTTEKPNRPQNKSYPAGGKKQARSAPTPDAGGGQRGVIVTPPSGNTPPPSRPEMIVLHRGFDTLALAIRANIPPDLFETLEKHKTLAEEERREVKVMVHGLTFLMKGHGGGGYRFLLNGGPDGANWSFKKPNPKDPWGIRLSFGSYFMAMHGLGAAKAHVDHVMDALGIRYTADAISISRADVCVDILAPDFKPIPEHFVMHSSTRRSDHIDQSQMKVNGKSGRTTSVTIGGPRNRQVIVYDKRAEVIAHTKGYWWDIWNHTLRNRALRYDTLRENNAQNAPYDTLRSVGPLTPNPDDADNNRVWRVEFRAGKDLLKDTWGITTWEDLFARFGDLCQQTGTAVRYTDPPPADPNRARWPNHPLWDIACAEINDDLFEMRSGADPNPMKEVHREEHINLIYRSVLGNSITLAALRGKEPSELPDMLEELGREMGEDVSEDPERSAKQLQDAKDRYVFIQRNGGDP